jgi:hypothetical protein
MYLRIGDENLAAYLAGRRADQPSRAGQTRPGRLLARRRGGAPDGGRGYRSTSTSGNIFTSQLFAAATLAFLDEQPPNATG